MHTNILSKFKFTIANLVLIFPIIFLYSCGGPTIHAMNAYKDCSYRYENIVDVDQCASRTIASFTAQHGSGSVYGRSDPDLQVYKGLVYKVKTNQLSNSAAKNKYQQYLQAKENKRADDARKIGEFSDGLNCILFQTNC